jgi:hypothetical protein
MALKIGLVPLIPFHFIRPYCNASRMHMLDIKLRDILECFFFS